MIVNEDCIKHLKTIEDNYFDSVVTDPPYELGFMGKNGMVVILHLRQNYGKKFIEH